MENQGVLEKINSNYIFKNIFTYIKDYFIKCKLFKYSKLFRKKLNLDLFFYQKQYFENIGINFFKYL